MLLSWNRVYDFPLRQLGVRTIAKEGDDFSGKCDIKEQWIFNRLHAPQNLCWGDDLSIWDLINPDGLNALIEPLRPPLLRSHEDL